MTYGSKSLYLQSLAALIVSAAMCAPGAFAQANNDPPPSGAILDLAGQTVNHGPATSESVAFTADLTSTDITFAFREDPAFISFSDVSLTNLSTGSLTNLITNGTFAGGSSAGWTYANIYGATFGGVGSTDCGGGLASCWYDGAVQAYDAIDQFVGTIVGDNYLLSFVYSDNGTLTTFSQLSTNGDTTDTNGNGIDILAYAQAGLPPAGTVTPEPDSLWLMSTGAVMLAAAFYYKRRNSMNDVRF